MFIARRHPDRATKRLRLNSRAKWIGLGRWAEMFPVTVWRIILKSDTTVYVYDRPFGTELSDALVSPVNVVNPPYTAEPQGGGHRI